MNFASDNWAGAAPPIGKALAAQGSGYAAAYGASDLDKAVEAKFSAVFEREVAVLFVATGSAANALAIACAMKPGGVFIAHREAHVVEDECGGPEFFSGGRIESVGGDLAKIDPAALARHLKRYDPPFLHHGRAAGVSMTQASEAGAVYSLKETAELARLAHRLGLVLHMDGARFANALVHLDASPAQMTWKAGVDILTFSGTKNGCWCADALVLFDPAMRESAEYLRKRSGQLFSKSRFIAAQFDAYFRDDLWLRLARHANAMANRLRAGIARSKTARLAWDNPANEVFMIAGRQTQKKLRAAGAQYYEWHIPPALEGKLEKGESICRLVTNFSTSAKEVDAFLRHLS